MNKIKKKSLKKPLTLEELMNYNDKVFIPALEERFVSKKEFQDFQDKNFKILDAILKKSDILIKEKEIKQFQ